ncbi:hypothetical protein ACTWOG_000955 [Serratia marcescens]
MLIVHNKVMRLAYLRKANSALQAFHFRCAETAAYRGRFPDAQLERAPEFYQVEAIRALRDLAITAQDAGQISQSLILMQAVNAWEEDGIVPQPFPELDRAPAGMFEQHAALQ